MNIDDFVRLKDGEGKVKSITIEAIEKGEDGLKRYWATTDRIDRDMEILDPDGMQWDQFKENNVLLYVHDAYSLPVGNVVNLRREKTESKNGWTFEPEWFPEGLDEQADKVRKLVELGRLKCFSVRFIPVEVEDLEYEKAGAYRKYTKWELLEISVVPIPANPDAGPAKNKAISPDDAVKALDKLLEDEADIEAANESKKEAEIEGMEKLEDVKKELETSDEPSFTFSGYMSKSGDDIEINILESSFDMKAMDVEPDTVTIKFKLDDDTYEYYNLRKAGAVLNKKNKGNLKQAQDLIQSVIDSADSGEDAPKVMTDDEFDNAMKEFVNDDEQGDLLNEFFPFKSQGTLPDVEGRREKTATVDDVKDPMLKSGMDWLRHNGEDEAKRLKAAQEKTDHERGIVDLSHLDQ